MSTNFSNLVYEIKGTRSIRQMGKDTGVSASYITGILKGQYYPTLKILKRFTLPANKPQGNVNLLDLIHALEEDNVMDTMVKTFNVKMTKEDYELLNEYGFHFEKNFEQMVKDVATEIRSYTEG